MSHASTWSFMLLLGGLMAAPETFAQDTRTAYRCTDGQYSQTPCPGGRQINPDPAPTGVQQAQARESAAAQARMAEQLRAERHARERAALGQAPARIGPAMPAAQGRAASAASRGLDDGKARPKKPRKSKSTHRLGQSTAEEPKSRKAYAPRKAD